MGACAGTLVVFCLCMGAALGQQAEPSLDVLSVEEWERVDDSVDRALEWLADQQQRDGSFPTLPTGQPGVTSLAVTAFLSAGHLPGEGIYGEQLNRAIDFALDCQREDGLFSQLQVNAVYQHNGASHAAHYNHAITGVMLGEVYGMCHGERQQKVRSAIERALVYMRDMQNKPKADGAEQGGWRYYSSQNQSDLSVTAWQIMFMRSAKNAQFDVPAEHVDEATAYVKRCFDPAQKTFLYRRTKPEEFLSRGVVASGILVLSLSGDHNSPLATQSGDWLLGQSFREYNQGVGPYHYGAYYASQATFQLGGKYWRHCYPEIAQTLTKSQGPDGAWDIEQNYNGGAFGRCYTTALATLALTTPYQLLPIYQR